MPRPKKTSECQYPGCEEHPYIGPVCKDHFEQFQRDNPPGDVDSWLSDARAEADEDDTDRHEPENGVCSHEDCTRECDQDMFCHGCKHFVCEEHAINYDMPMGPHDVEIHFMSEEEAEEYL